MSLVIDDARRLLSSDSPRYGTVEGKQFYIKFDRGTCTFG
jgi:hypothetical protein